MSIKNLQSLIREVYPPTRITSDYVAKDYSLEDWIGQYVRVEYYDSLSFSNKIGYGIIKNVYPSGVVVELERNHKTVKVPLEFVTVLNNQEFHLGNNVDESYTQLKNIIKEELLQEWDGKLQDNYDGDFEQFVQYDDIYNIANRLGYDDAEVAWEDNPVIHVGVDPSELKILIPGSHDKFNKNIWNAGEKLGYEDGDIPEINESYSQLKNIIRENLLKEDNTYNAELYIEVMNNDEFDSEMDRETIKDTIYDVLARYGIQESDLIDVGYVDQDEECIYAIFKLNENTARGAEKFKEEFQGYQFTGFQITSIAINEDNERNSNPTKNTFDWNNTPNVYNHPTGLPDLHESYTQLKTIIRENMLNEYPAEAEDYETHMNLGNIGNIGDRDDKIKSRKDNIKKQLDIDPDEDVEFIGNIFQSDKDFEPHDINNIDPNYQEFDDSYDLCQNEDEVNAVKEMFPNIPDYQFYIIKIIDGEIIEVYGNNFPSADKDEWDNLTEYIS